MQAADTLGIIKAVEKNDTEPVIPAKQGGKRSNQAEEKRLLDKLALESLKTMRSGKDVLAEWEMTGNLNLKKVVVMVTISIRCCRRGKDNKQFTDDQ